jgi:NAD(P)-dependent dehydrogenase (short-subunit alcohol dehydrogenase family)
MLKELFSKRQMMNKTIEKKVVLVTGGSRGIGQGIAKGLAACGYPVALTYLRYRESAEDTALSIVSSGGRAIAVHLAVEDRNSIRKAVSTIKTEMGPINILVNNAAIAQEKPFESITDADWDRVLATNLRGPFACTQEVLPDMLTTGWGRIINISSIGGQWGGFNQVHYAAAKAGLINFTRSMAKIYSHAGITCNAIAPGLIATDMSAAELETEAGKTKVKNIPAGRLGSVEEVAAAVSFLCTDEAAYITGQTLNLNGGMFFG